MTISDPLAASVRRILAARKRVAYFQKIADGLVDKPDLHRDAVKLLFVMEDALFEMEQTHQILERVYRTRGR